jgi:hypothetical protein
MITSKLKKHSFQRLHENSKPNELKGIFHNSPKSITSSSSCSKTFDDQSVNSGIPTPQEPTQNSMSDYVETTLFRIDSLIGELNEVSATLDWKTKINILYDELNDLN